jgi:hypothetical protein
MEANMTLLNRRCLLLVSAMALASGLACEKNVQEVRRPGQPRDPYAAIRGAPIGYTSSPNTGIRGAPTAMGGGSINTGLRATPQAPTAQAKAGFGSGAINPAGTARATGSPSAVSPTDHTRARGATGSATVPGGAPRTVTGSAWSPTDHR